MHPFQSTVTRHAARVACISTMALLLGGCDSGPKYYPVKGKVVIKGSNNTLTEGTLLFRTVTKPEVLASGYVEDDGTFELYSNQGKPGTIEGEQEILIQPPELEYGQNKVVDDRFRTFETSGLKQTVKA